MYRLNVNKEFDKRTKSVFDSLESLEVKHKTKQTEYMSESNQTEEQEEDVDPSELNPIDDSVFKVPDVPKRLNHTNDYKIVKKQMIRPDYELNPGKWKKYSLEDVKEHTTSSNYSAALNFITSRNTIVEQEEAFENNNTDIVFNKPIGKKTKQIFLVEDEETEEMQFKQKAESNTFKKTNKKRTKTQRTRQYDDEFDETKSDEIINDIEIKEIESDSSQEENETDQVDFDNYLA